MGGLVDAITGNGRTTSQTSVNIPEPTADEKALIQLNTQLAQKQIANLDQLQPFQQAMLKQSMADLQRQGALNSAYDAAITPEQQAAAAKSEFDRAQKMGPMQDQLLQMQLDQLKSGGAATPEQQQRIKEATDAAITAGNTDIDASTQRGIGLIADELANSRGLRLSDSPIGSEAALLAREGVIQKGSLEKNLRAGQASAVLNYPLAVQSLQGGINLGQQNVSQAAQQFQAQLRQQAVQNRMSMFGTSSNSGLGLASIGSGVGASTLGTLANRSAQNKFISGSSFNPNETLLTYNKIASDMSKGIGQGMLGMGSGKG